MGTLLLRLAGPMQSWGVQSHFTHRDTGLEPSKSGVIGLLCAALGKPRDEAHPANADKPPLAQLASMHMGVRVDVEGLLKRDYHTASNVMKAGGKPFSGLKPTELSERFYLADAAFLVGFGTDDEKLLRTIYQSLRRPVWMLFLGRKAFVPGEPIWLSDGLKLDQELEDALRSYPRIALPGSLQQEDGDASARSRLILEDAIHGSVVRPDHPVSFQKGSRQHLDRRVRIDFCVPPEPTKETPQCISRN